MKIGDEIVCEHCGANAFLVKKSIMDGWTKVGENLCCSACNAVIHEIKEEEKPKETKDDKKLESLNKLEGFLGTKQEEKPKIEEVEKRFCRDCKYYIHHPFVNRCSLLERATEPMKDCEFFSKKEE